MIDSTFEWWLLALLVTVTAAIFVPIALGMGVFYIGKAIYHRKLDFLIERE